MFFGCWLMTDASGNTSELVMFEEQNTAQKITWIVEISQAYFAAFRLTVDSPLARSPHLGDVSSNNIHAI